MCLTVLEVHLKCTLNLIFLKNMLAVIINKIKGHLRVLYESTLSWLCLTQLGQAHVEEEGLEAEVDTGARVVLVEQEDREQTPPLPHKPCLRTLWAPGVDSVGSWN